MTAPLTDRWTPSPERAWQIAVEGGLRINDETKAAALTHAAIQTDAHWSFVGGENWVTIRRLMVPRWKADEFIHLVNAVREGLGPVIKAEAARLVNPS